MSRRSHPCDWRRACELEEENFPSKAFKEINLINFFSLRKSYSHYGSKQLSFVQSMDERGR